MHEMTKNGWRWRKNRFYLLKPESHIHRGFHVSVCLNFFSFPAMPFLLNAQSMFGAEMKTLFFFIISPSLSLLNLWQIVSIKFSMNYWAHCFVLNFVIISWLQFSIRSYLHSPLPITILSNEYFLIKFYCFEPRKMMINFIQLRSHAFFSLFLLHLLLWASVLIFFSIFWIHL